MSVLHVFSIAEGGWQPGVSQFRYHESIPWDEAYDLFDKPDQLRAMVLLSRQAAGPHGKLRGRIFDAMRAVEAAKPPKGYERRDHGPFALVTNSAVLHRIELEEYLKELTIQEWQQARDMAGLIHNGLAANLRRVSPAEI